MADVTLTAQIRGNIDNLNQTMGAAVRTVTTSSNQIDVAAGRASRAIQGINPASNSAAFALTNLGRVAQDAPFGFIGIQNNINPLLESFQRLRSESGSTGGALRALASSLTGAAGLGIAVSLVTSALTLYTQYQQRSAKATKEAKSANDEFINSATKEVVSLTSLYNATQNSNLSLQERQAAVDGLQKQYPGYFKNMSDEAILAGKAEAAYNSLTDAIISQAVVKGAQSNIEKLTKPLVDLIVQQKTAQAQYEKNNSDFFKKTGRALAAPQTAFEIDEKGDLQKVGSYKKNLTSAIKDAQAGLQQILQDFGINSLLGVKGGEKGNSTLRGFDIVERKIREISTALETAVLNDQPTVASRLAVELTAANEELKKFKQTFENSLLAGKGAPDLIRVTPDISTPTSGLGTDPTTLAGMQGAIDKLQELILLKGQARASTKEYNAELEREKNNLGAVTSLIGGGLTQAFEQTLQGTQSFVSAMGQFLSQLITKLVAAALAAAALSALLRFTGIGSLLGISSGASSFGNVFKGLSGLNFLAEGGITNGPTLAMIGEGREKEIVAPLSKFDQMVSDRAGQNGGGFEPFMIGADMWLKQKTRAEKYNGRTK